MTGEKLLARIERPRLHQGPNGCHLEAHRLILTNQRENAVAVFGPPKLLKISDRPFPVGNRAASIANGQSRDRIQGVYLLLAQPEDLPQTLDRPEVGPLAN